MVAGLLLALWIDEWFAPWFPFWFLITAFAMIAASRELVRLLESTSICPSGNSVIGGVLAIVIANWIPHVAVEVEIRRSLPPSCTTLRVPWLPWLILLCFVAVVMVSFVVQSVQFEKPGRTTLASPGQSSSWLTSGSWAASSSRCDGSGMAARGWWRSSSWSRRRRAPIPAPTRSAGSPAGTSSGRPEPQKTVEGAVGGLLFAVGAALIVTAIVRASFDVPTLDWRMAVLYGLIIGTVAQLGDLMESMIKRDCERKDASEAVPGFGGVLDVIDSLIFAGPVAYVLWLWLGP